MYICYHSNSGVVRQIGARVATLQDTINDIKYMDIPPVNNELMVYNFKLLVVIHISGANVLQYNYMKWVKCIYTVKSLVFLTW